MKFLSQVYTSVSGSVGGITYFNGRFGHMVARARSIPTDPSSIFQTIMRTSWSAAQGLWVRATEVVRSKWDQYAATVVYQGPTGPYKVNGRERFLATLSVADYLNRTQGTNIPVTDAPPVGMGWLLLTDLALTPLEAAGTGFNLAVGNTNDHDIDVLVSISQPLESTINFWKGPWDTANAQHLAVPTDTVATLTFDGLEDEKIYFIQVRAVSHTDEHRISEKFILRGLSALYVL